MKKIKLSKRLGAIAGYIEKCRSIIDVGTDHGYIPIYAAQNELAEYIAASDISEGPLQSARRNAVEFGVAERIRFVAAAGLSGVCETDTVIIAGMGGEMIAEILSGAPWTKNHGVRLVLQPQTKKDVLCRWLHDNGYAIRDASLVYDGNRLYAVILAGAGRCAEKYGEPECELLMILAKKRDPLFEAYANELISKARRAAEGMRISDAEGYMRMVKRAETFIQLKEDAGID